MKNISLKIIVLLTGLLFLSSCVLDQDRVDFGEGPKIVQFQKASETKSFVQKGDGVLVDYMIPIQSFGGDNLPSTTDVTVTVAVAASSVAKEGVEVTIPNKTVTIPAGQSSANLLVKVNPDKIVVGSPRNLVLDIVSASQTISNGKERTTSKLQTICASNLAGEYVYTVGHMKNVTITADGVGKYKVNRDAFYGSDYEFSFSDNCGNLTVTGGVLSAANAQSGTGTVDNVTGDITFSYTILGTAVSNRTMTLKKK